jgi:hypothetical protein
VDRPRSHADGHGRPPHRRDERTGLVRLAAVDGLIESDLDRLIAPQTEGRAVVKRSCPMSWALSEIRILSISVSCEMFLETFSYPSGRKTSFGNFESGCTRVAIAGQHSDEHR